jgi:Tfp pilus assembly protein FimV
MLAFQPTPAPIGLRLQRPVRARRVVAPASPATYRRRRFVAGLLLAAVVLAAVIGVSWHTRPAPGDIRARPVAAHEVVVQPGDTVWSIASELAGGTDVRPVVDAIVAANGGADLVAGQRLAVTVP